MPVKKMYCLNVSLSDELRAEYLRAVLAYEAAARGLTLGQVVVDLVTEAVDVDSYPDEVREQLDQIAEQTRRDAVRKSLSAMGGAVAGAVREAGRGALGEARIA